MQDAAQADTGCLCLGRVGSCGDSVSTTVSPLNHLDKSVSNLDQPTLLEAAHETRTNLMAKSMLGSGLFTANNRGPQRTLLVLSMREKMNNE